MPKLAFRRPNGRMICRPEPIFTFRRELFGDNGRADIRCHWFHNTRPIFSMRYTVERWYTDKEIQEMQDIIEDYLRLFSVAHE